MKENHPEERLIKTNKEGDAEQGEQQEDQPPNPVPRREVRVGRPPQVPQTPFLD